MLVDTKKRILAMGGGGAALAALLGFLVWAQSDQIDSLTEKAKGLEQDIAKARARIAQTPSLEREVILQRETDEVARTILPNDEDILNFVRTLRTFEKESGVRISQIKDKSASSSKKSKNKDDFEKVAYEVNFEADAFQLLSFLNFVESHERFMRVPSFTLKAAKRDAYAGDPGEARHEVDLEVESYVYRPRSGSKRVDIDGYDRKRDLLATEISARQREMTIPAYDYEGARNRRDPWVDPRMPANLEPGDLVLSIEDQIDLVEDLVARTKEAAQLLDRWRSANNLIADIESRSVLEKSLSALEEEARRIEADKQLRFIPAERRFRVEVMDEIARIRRSLAETEDQQVPIAVLRQAVETMHSHLAASEYDLALEAFAGVEGRLASAERDPQRAPYVEQLRKYQHMAETVLEFQKLELDVRGLVDLGPKGRVALINGKTYAPGELVTPDLLLLDIASDQLTFVYKEVEMTRPVSQ
ncbi:MAG: hypothetical protein R3F34_11830 [Planctomycetota bacterium]